MNIVNGRVENDPSVNVHLCTEIGVKQVQKFEKSWPAGFHGTIQKLVKPMNTKRKNIMVDNKPIFDSEVVYLRAMVLRSAGRDLDIQSLLKYELSPLPTSMFDENGLMRKPAKSELKNLMKVSEPHPVS